MSRGRFYRERLISISQPTLIVLLGCGLSVAQPMAVAQALAAVTVWTCVAVPVAVLFGHCALSED